MNRFSKDFSITTFSTIIIIVIAFLNNIVVTRQIGPSGRGKYAIILNLVILITLLLGEGIRKNNLLLIQDFKKQLNIIFTQNIIYIFLTLIVFVLLYYLRTFWISLIPDISDEFLLLGLLITLFTIFCQSIQSLFLGLQEIVYYNLIQLFPIAVTFILNILGIYFFNFNLFEIIFNMLVGAVSTSIIILFYFRNDLRFQIPNKLKRQKSYSIIFKSTVSAAQLFLIFRGDIFLVNYYLGTFSAGIYSIAVIFSEILQKVPNIAGPLLISKSVQDDLGNSILNTSRLSRVIIFFNFTAICLLYLFGEYLIKLLFGIKFIDAYPVLLYLFPALLFFGSGSIFYSYFISKSYPRMVLVINGTVSVLNIALNIIFIPIYGIIGAASISSLTYFLWTVIFGIYFHQHTKIPLSDIFIVKKQDFKYILGFLKI